MKQKDEADKFREAASHPSRVRGLKLVSDLARNVLDWSHPSRVRGLKLNNDGAVEMFEQVAPLAGAWIETLSSSRWPATVTSHPSRVRGLKL